MENILSHYIPNISFDIQSLRKIEGDLERKRRDSEGGEPPTEIDLDELEDLAIDDEDFSIRELPDNTARRCFPLRFNGASISGCGRTGHWMLIAGRHVEYSGEFSYLNLSMKIRRKIGEWMHNAAPEV
jgi:hypothetical protein